MGCVQSRGLFAFCMHSWGCLCVGSILGLSVRYFYSASKIALLNPSIFSFYCGWYVVVSNFSTLRTRHMFEMIISVNLSPSSDKSHLDGPYINTRWFTNAFAFVAAVFQESGIVFISLENLLVTINRNRFPRFVVATLPRLSMATNFSSAVAGNSFMPFLFHRMVALLFAQLKRLLFDCIAL